MPVYGKDFNYTGDYTILDDSDSDGIKWRVKFLSSGTFTPLTNMLVDVFLVGGGGGGYSASTDYDYTQGGGGGGYTNTSKSIVLTANEEYSIVIASGGSICSRTQYAYSTGRGTDGGTSTAFNQEALGGKLGYTNSGRYNIAGNGGSGGGSSDKGGTDGSNGTAYQRSSTNPNWYYAGAGQGTTTREFGESTGDLYAGGGGTNLTEIIANSGNGSYGRLGSSSGIVIIRNHRE